VQVLDIDTLLECGMPFAELQDMTADVAKATLAALDEEAA
jgi:hypothetical protein